MCHCSSSAKRQDADGLRELRISVAIWADPRNENHRGGHLGHESDNRRPNDDAGPVDCECRRVECGRHAVDERSGRQERKYLNGERPPGAEDRPDDRGGNKDERRIQRCQQHHLHRHDLAEHSFEPAKVLRHLPENDQAESPDGPSNEVERIDKPQRKRDLTDDSRTEIATDDERVDEVERLPEQIRRRVGASEPQ